MKQERTGISLLTHQPFQINYELLQSRRAREEPSIRKTLRYWFYLAGSASLWSAALLFRS